MSQIHLSARARETARRYRDAGHKVTTQVVEHNYVIRILQYGLEDCAATGIDGTAESAFWHAYAMFGMNTRFW